MAKPRDNRHKDLLRPALEEVIDLAHPNTPYYTYVVSVLPLAPGRYEFFGEFHPNTAKGVVIAE